MARVGDVTIVFDDGDNNGSPILSGIKGHEIQLFPGVAPYDIPYEFTPESYTDVNGKIHLSITLYGLTMGVVYQARIHSVNAIGDGKDLIINNIMPHTKPKAPTITSITPGNGSLTVAFTDASYNPGLPIDKYQYSIDGGTTYTELGNITSPFIINGLTNGTQYTVTLESGDSDGYSADSVPVIATPSTVPSAPTITSIDPSNASLTINFTAPINTGGAAISNYAYSTNGGTSVVAISPSNTSSPITITTQSIPPRSPLVNGDPYSVKIYAINVNGTGAASNAVNCTPGNDAPGLIYGLPSDNAAYVYFTAGTGTVTNYQYSTDGGSTWNVLSPADTNSPVYIPGLTNDTPINIQLQAIKSAGNSSASNSITVTPSNPSVPVETLLYDPNNSSSYSGTGTVVTNIGNYGTMTGTKSSDVGWVDGNGAASARKVFNFVNGPNSSTTSYITYGAFDFGSNFTISAWVYPVNNNGSTSYNINGILSNVGAGANTSGFKVAWNGWLSSNLIMLLEAGGGAPITWGTNSSANNTVTVGAWQYLTYAFDKSNRRIIFYKNGVPTTQSGAGITTTANIDTSNPSFFIGAYVGPSYGMRGQLGLIKVFNSTLNAAQVLTDFNNTKADFGL